MRSTGDERRESSTTWRVQGHEQKVDWTRQARVWVGGYKKRQIRVTTVEIPQNATKRHPNSNNDNREIERNQGERKE